MMTAMLLMSCTIAAPISDDLFGPIGNNPKESDFQMVSAVVVQPKQPEVKQEVKQEVKKSTPAQECACGDYCTCCTTCQNCKSVGKAKAATPVTAPTVSQVPTHPRPAGDGWQWDAEKQHWWKVEKTQPVIPQVAPVQIQQRSQVSGSVQRGHHSHTCAAGHTWSHADNDPNASHNCPICGRAQFVQDSTVRQQTVVPVQNQVFQQITGGCASGNCPIQTQGYQQFNSLTGGCANGNCSAPTQSFRRR